MTIKTKAVRVLTWALGAILVSAGVAWAATLWRVDSYGNIKSARSTVLLAAGQASNCKLDVTGTTLSIIGTNDAALSVSNPCLVGLNDGSVATFTAPVSVTFGAASDTDGNLFGIAEADWKVDSSGTNSAAMPIFLGVIRHGGGTPYFTISRLPAGRGYSSVATLCQKNDTDCDDEQDVMILGSGLTLADFVNTPMTQAGWFFATYDTGTTAWTFALDVDGWYRTGAGFNMMFEYIEFNFPTGQMGAEANRFTSSAGTDPSFSMQYFRYKIFRNRIISLLVALNNGSGGTAGSGANTLYFHVPFTPASTGQLVHGRTRNGATNAHAVVSLMDGSGGGLSIMNTSSGNYYTCNSFNDANTRSMMLSGTYFTS